MFAGTLLNEEDSDAFHRLVQNAKIKLPPSQLTFEKAQQLLREKGHEGLATNLRARLNEGITLLVLQINLCIIFRADIIHKQLRQAEFVVCKDNISFNDMV